MRERNRQYYADNREVQKARVVERNRRYRKELREFLKLLKDQQPCLDCGVAYPWYVMDFDHVTDDKLYDVSIMIGNLNSKKKILQEIAKCELVCANCHRIRTFSHLIDTM